MKIILKILSFLVISVLINAQEREDSDLDRQTLQQFQNPIRRLVGRDKERLKHGSTFVRQRSGRIVRAVPNIINDVRRRTEQLEQSIGDQITKLRPQVVQAKSRLTVLEEEKIKLNQQIQVVSNQFNEKKQEYKSGLQQQKDIIERHIRSKDFKDPKVYTELQKESEKLNKKIDDINKLTLTLDSQNLYEETEPTQPTVYGLGDGYGRHLKE